MQNLSGSKRKRDYMVSSSILQDRVEELRREIEILDKRIILMQDEVAEIDKTLANRSVTSIKNIIQERERTNDRRTKQDTKRQLSVC